ncbi:MAG: vWA domain-containing protein [Rhodococcus sp. (in: high G+C Gram-positive bacteria)]|uniref:vWA domain-containing protein n=1 Tax=Rhodococcus sp. TaxID=1831 RepID=UPI002AD81ED8|nr:vWA domain-containing protein [Rhodococcus sp. (in: high G+C Gram-positive bacteria)]
MTNLQPSLVAALLDRSGSMHSIADDTCGGFDSFITKEREADGKTVVTLAQFDDQYELVYDNTPIEDVAPLVLEPRGGTAFYDAIGRLISDVGAGLAAMPEDERPGSVTVLVMTDGHENSSREWTNAAVRELIKRQESEYSWHFVFLGSNIDAVEVGADLGFQRGKSMTYVSTSVGVTAAFDSVADYQHRKRSAGVDACSVSAFTPEDRRRVRGESKAVGIDERQLRAGERFYRLIAQFRSALTGVDGDRPCEVGTSEREVLIVSMSPDRMEYHFTPVQPVRIFMTGLPGPGSRQRHRRNLW